MPMIWHGQAVRVASLCAARSHATWPLRNESLCAELNKLADPGTTELLAPNMCPAEA